jgi:superfamily II DNA or RNA helicase
LHRILNILQDDALRELESAHHLWSAGGLVVLPPGTGKMRIAAEDAKRLGAKRLLYVAHTHEILDVAQSECEALFGADNVGRHSTVSSLRLPATVNLTTIQLLRKHLFPRNAFNYIVVDEFHHAPCHTGKCLSISLHTFSSG